MKTITFGEVKDLIKSELNNKKRKIKIKESVHLMEGFINTPFSNELSDSFILGGTTVPMIMLIGNTSGQVYFFILKELLPEIEY